MRFFFYDVEKKSTVKFTGVNFVEDNMVPQCQKVRHLSEGFGLYSTERRKHYSAWKNLRVHKLN